MKIEFYHKLDVNRSAVKRQDIYFVKSDGKVYRNFRSFAKYSERMEFNHFVEESPTIGWRIISG